MSNRFFRRTALHAALLALPVFAISAQAADIPQVKITVNDKQCEPMALSIPAGKTQFIVHNASQKGLEWEILKGVMVVEERENIAPGFTQKMTANLEPGEYDMTCGLLSNPKGKLTVTAAASTDTATKPDAMALVGPIAEYKIYVTQEVAQLVTQTKTFTDAVKKGDLALARKLYAPTRQHYERIEPIAELFSDLDGSIDAREDDFEQKAADPKFTGFHRLEKILFGDNTTKGADQFANQLYQDTLELQKRIAGLTFAPNKVVGGAAGLIEEVAASKISGEEDRYSRTDLWDFQANVDGAQKIVNLLRPLLEKADKPLLDKIDANFKTVDSVLAKYRTKDGYESYEKLTDADRNAMKGPITTLAEDLAQLRGVLGLD
ncbi:iron uptake system protein EfeO [Yersinia enterocolitica]|uniref:Iron uptake system component EfeO n=1 Tax=Yersinia enterocolitica serotype O:8 / biotype 1B (strain NCTC 13174 / 8081) TaxID=393305 RepID=A1JMT4_YERE8|nr:iron uptake system protein EfeO [Yersinia enterocolitica]AJJ25180.1 imelysin family protein [Yersinia enterocolitica]CAL12018.1 putative exported protein [Yersinia enterocolitica subsp. enterocolitica 8081]CRY00821.1 ferrous iron transport periplasmic protein EfeO%2Ccontains peptidase-M75 domain and (frequently) cupredoxin-like domain [Yersinia enterocolitica]HDL8279487.1 iron uptake system protein EfeO [Yersinia enterocolitica]HDM8290809.1 iron uptake system protein EfeO [Yersinia enteroco